MGLQRRSRNVGGLETSAERLGESESQEFGETDAEHLGEAVKCVNLWIETWPFSFETLDTL